MLKHDTVTIFRSFVKSVHRLTDAEKGKIYHAVCLYSLDGIEPQLPDDLDGLFDLMRPVIDKSNKRKSAQQNSVQSRLQKHLQNGSQNNTPPDLQKGSVSDLQNGSQNPPSHARLEGERKKRLPKGNPKEKISFVGLIPEVFKEDQNFVKAWLEWEEYRRKKRKPVSEMAAKKELNMLAQYPVADAIESINTSIRNDWQGIFEPKAQPGKPAANPPKSKYTGEF